MEDHVLECDDYWRDAATATTSNTPPGETAHHDTDDVPDDSTSFVQLGKRVLDHQPTQRLMRRYLPRPLPVGEVPIPTGPPAPLQPGPVTLPTAAAPSHSLPSASSTDPLDLLPNLTTAPSSTATSSRPEGLDRLRRIAADRATDANTETQWEAATAAAQAGLPTPNGKR